MKVKQDAVFLHAAVVADDRAERSDPARQIAIDRVALLFQNAGGPFVLFLDADAPVVVDPIIAAERKEAAVVEEWVIVQIAMPEIDLKIRDSAEAHARVHFGESLVEHGHLRGRFRARPRARA